MGRMMQRLLNRSLLYYAVFAACLLLMSTPLFYFVIQKMYLAEVNETIIEHSVKLKNIELAGMDENIIPVWNRLNPDRLILPDTVLAKKNVIIKQYFKDDKLEGPEPYHVLYSDISINGKPHVLMLRANLLESEDLIQTIALLYVFIILALLIGMLAVATFVSRKLWKPFYNILNSIKTFDIQKRQIPSFSASTIIEFQQLSKALEKLIRQNIEAYKAQKEFIDNASHELQTPLAIFKSKLDLLLQSSSLQENEMQVIQSLFEASSRLTRINKNLILLSKIENDQYDVNESVEIREIVVDALAYFKEQAEEKQINIDMRILHIPLIVTANPGLVEIMVYNLISNAIRHNNEGGSVYVELHKDVLIIANKGQLQALTKENLFKRFTKVSDEASGTGLGLAIVGQICRRYGWRISYRFEHEKHFFIISFHSEILQD